MDDLNQKISEIMSNPGEMEKLKNMAAQLFGSSAPAAPAPPPQQSNDSVLGLLAGAENISGLIKAASALNFSGDDESVRLLLALKPHLSAERCTRVDHAVRILKMLKMAPLLEKSGILKF